MKQFLVYKMNKSRVNFFKKLIYERFRTCFFSIYDIVLHTVFAILIIASPYLYNFQCMYSMHFLREKNRVKV